jgi:hypothetical protein
MSGLRAEGGNFRQQRGVGGRLRLLVPQRSVG